MSYKIPSSSPFIWLCSLLFLSHHSLPSIFSSLPPSPLPLLIRSPPPPPPYRAFAGEEEKTQVQIRAEIDQHLKDKAKIESVVPQNIIIGPFFINTDPTRLALAKKHKDIASALLSFLANSLRKITEEVCVYDWQE